MLKHEHKQEINGENNERKFVLTCSKTINKATISYNILKKGTESPMPHEMPRNKSQSAKQYIT